MGCKVKLSSDSLGEIHGLNRCDFVRLGRNNRRGCCRLHSWENCVPKYWHFPMTFAVNQSMSVFLPRLPQYGPYLAENAPQKIREHSVLHNE